MKRINLTQGKYALVSDEDYDELNKVKWFYDGAYAARKSPKKTYMHRLINDTPSGLETDHIDKNKLNNQRSNLRTVTSSQNSLNITVRDDNKSGYTGVFWRRDKSKWSVYITKHGKRTYLGQYKTKDNAVRARQKAEELYA